MIVALSGIFAPIQKGKAQLPAEFHEDADLREMIGQMLMVSFDPNNDSADTLHTDIRERNLGGVLLFDYHAESPESLQQLTGELHEKADTPLFIAIDQEGGEVARLNEENYFEQTKTAEELGEADSEQQTRDQAALMAGWLKDGGININLAPVVDVNINPDSPVIGGMERSFSDDPETVTDHAGWFTDEFKEQGIITALKHFPGHGSAEVDSHDGFTDISHTWEDVELDPYLDLLDDGYPGMIMPGHLFHEDFDPDHPATLSEEILRGKLRDEMDFDGVIISDGMLMGAIQEHYGFFESVKLAINAGMDILLYSNNEHEELSLVRQLKDYVEDEVSQGNISRETIENSFNRIMKMKEEQLQTEASIIAESDEIPEDFNLTNYPNPFNPTTTISFELPEQQQAQLEIYDIQGRKVEKLVDGPLNAGSHTYEFDGSGLSSGVYIYRLVTPEYQITQKMTLVN